MLEMQNVTKFYRIKEKRHYILRDVSFNFSEKKSIGILGPNGAGKSTLLRMLGGIELPNYGKIKLHGGTVSWPVSLTAGFQGSLTARENIKFVCRIYNKTIAEQQKIINFVYEFAEIGKFFDMPVKTYSSGMKGRINFGLSMAFNFDYYLVDEVTGVGDAAFKAKSRAVFADKRKRSSIIMVSHSIKSLRANCDSGVYLKNGQLILYEDIDDAIKAYQKSQ